MLGQLNNSRQLREEAADQLKKGGDPLRGVAFALMAISAAIEETSTAIDVHSRDLGNAIERAAR